MADVACITCCFSPRHVLLLPCVLLQIEVDAGFGQRCEVNLMPGGANVPVTRSNVTQYCELYVQHLLVHSIQRQFAAFQRGFLRLCSGAALQLFRYAALKRQHVDTGLSGSSFQCVSGAERHGSMLRVPACMWACVQSSHGACLHGTACAVFVWLLVKGDRRLTAHCLRHAAAGVFSCIRPAELEQLVCGSRVVDLTALEAATHYDDGYHRASAPVRWFWEVRIVSVCVCVCGSHCNAR